jgi:ribonucleoside-diphosphate reductase alpha chain
VGVVESPIEQPSSALSLSPSGEARDAPYCYECGNVMMRSGTCYVCPSCGTTSGCS